MTGAAAVTVATTVAVGAAATAEAVGAAASTEAAADTTMTAAAGVLLVPVDLRGYSRAFSPCPSAVVIMIIIGIFSHQLPLLATVKAVQVAVLTDAAAATTMTGAAGVPSMPVD